MGGGLIGLLDDVAALAKLAAASIDDIGAAAGKAGAKTIGVVVDDAAVTPAYVQGLAADREIPLIRRIAMGSLRNKLLIILPIALLLSALAPALIEILLMIGGAYLCYEGAHKVIHAVIHRRQGKLGAHDGGAEEAELPAVAKGPDEEEATVKGAIVTDFILSCEIMVIALKDVMDEPLVSRAIILTIVGLCITVGVYGLVALIVRMDDVGLSLIRSGTPRRKRMGTALVNGMPKLLAGLAIVGTAAMLWVGGHILLVGADELGWHAPYKLVHDTAHRVGGVGGVGGILQWLVGTLFSTALGAALGSLIAAAVAKLPRTAGADGHH